MKPVYSNDRTAPRMKKGEFSKMVITKKLLTKFKDEFPEYKNMDWKTFYQTWLEIADMIRYEAIYNPMGVKLGSYLGELKLQYLPYKLKAEDFDLSQKEGTKLNYLNIDIKGKNVKIKWERREAVKRNKVLQFYAFDQTRELNRLSATYMEKNSDKLRTARVTLGGHANFWTVNRKK